MLSHWSLGGFKSFGEKQSIEMSPITIFCGANSSGKSTILQSILLLKQTVQYGSSNKPIALNGPLIRLGTFDDVSNYNSQDRRIYVDFKFNNRSSGHQFSYLASWLRHLSRPFPRSENIITSVSGSFGWVPQSIAGGDGESTSYDKLQGILSRGELVVTRLQGEDLKNKVDSFAKFSSLTQPYVSQDVSSTKWAKVQFDALSEAELTQGRSDPSIGIMWLNFFLPGAVGIHFNEAKERAHRLVESLFQPSSLLSRSRLENEYLPTSAAEILNNFLASNGDAPIKLEERGVAAVAANQRLQRFQRRSSLAVGAAVSRIVDEELQTLSASIEAALVESYPPKQGTDFGFPRALDSAGDFIVEYLKSGIRYLGPLRDEPKPVYPLEALENPTDVGYHGEHTAAVLYLNSNSVVEYIAPENFMSPTEGLLRKSTSLKNAVVQWLNYLGIATDVLVADAGVFGNQLRVMTEGVTQFHDLTNVGVGVSQVLPIVVSALLAPETSLLIFEQPELHLHPRVQARLADFFYSVALAGKQCILETHSEYMIDRLRRRIAEEEDDRLRGMLSIYFTERAHGETHCRPVSLSRFGAMNDWPKDFFEQSQMELKEILEAASRKKIRERKK